MQQYSFFALLKSVFFESLQLYWWTSTETRASASSGSGDLGHKELQPKAAGEYFQGWDEKYIFSLGVTGTHGKEEGGRGCEGKFIPVLLLLGQSTGPCIKKTTAFEVRHVGQSMVEYAIWQIQRQVYKGNKTEFHKMLNVSKCCNWFSALTLGH